jgi:hypothetical protein
MNKNFATSHSYVTPKIEVTEIISEGVLCSSLAAPDWAYEDETLD